jgi:hypothetical protein
VEEYDPERLEQEGRTIPLPPSLLGIKYFYWNHAPRAGPIGKDPLRWLKLSPEDWQVSGDQIVTKGQGGYGSDDDDAEDAWENLPRFPDQPNFGPSVHERPLGSLSAKEFNFSEPITVQIRGNLIVFDIPLS